MRGRFFGVVIDTSASHRQLNVNDEFSSEVQVIVVPKIFRIIYRFLETGLQSDFNKIRLKLVEISNLQIRLLMDKVRNMQEVICADSVRPDRHFFHEPQQQRKIMMTGAPQLLYRNSTPFYHCGGHMPKFPVDPRMLLGHPS